MQQKLELALERLKRGKNVQNRQLLALLGENEFARFEDEWREQKELRETLKRKPVEVAEYERRLKQALFTYSKADAASRYGRRQAATEFFAVADTQFERLVEYLGEHIAGNADLEAWFDRSVHFDMGSTPSGSADDFPCVVTSRSLRNRGGGFLNALRTKRQVKIDALERALEELQADDAKNDEVAKRLAAGRKLQARFAD